MKMRCNGDWIDGARHQPVVLGDHEPKDNPGEFDGCCDHCRKAMGADIICHLCKKMVTKSGICEYCETLLDETGHGKPLLRVVIFQLNGKKTVRDLDASDALSDIKNAWTLPGYCGLELQTIPESEAVPA